MNQKEKILEAARQYNVADRILKNHDRISKRFNIQSEVAKIKSKGLKNVTESCCEMIDTYNMKNINPNMVAQFLFQAAVVFTVYDMREEFFDMLGRYVSAMDVLFGEEIVLIKSDDYFDEIEEIIMLQNEIQQVPRDKRLIFESAMSIFEQPTFEKYKDDKRFIELKKILERKGEKICS